MSNNIWKNLIFNSRSSLQKFSNGTNWRLKGDDSPLEYKNRRYKSVAVHAAKQLAMSELEGELKKLIPKFKKHWAKQIRKTVLAQQTANQEQLILRQRVQSNQWGKVTTAEGDHTIIARDKYGNAVKEALMLYYEDESIHECEDAYNEDGSAAVEATYFTKTVCHIDLAPEVSMNSSKNIVMTQVQGRDYTRKELVSGGDLQFSISGNIVSNDRGVYPTDAVKKFIQVMEYNGILNVNFMMFESFNVTRVIVKDYSLNQQTYKNIQPYSFSCVAVEPDEAVKITSDTISTINKELSLSKGDKWYNLVLNNKMAEILVDGVANTAISAAVSSSNLGIDELLEKIGYQEYDN